MPTYHQNDGWTDGYDPSPSEYEDRPEPNIPALRRVVEWVEEQDTLPSTESEWKQTVWAVIRPGGHTALRPEPCGTAFCVAGKVVHDAGFQILYDDNSWDAGLCVAPEVPINYTERGTVTTEERRRIVTDLDPDYWESIKVQAAKILGLDEYQSDLLFQASNSAEMIRDLAEEFAGEPL